jgi:MerR family transcriptional regulator, light-induced transcriptional regulator
MRSGFSLPPGWLSIAGVERATGLGKDTLRVWERRYGFPVPSRDAFGERTYPPEQIEKLSLLRRLLDAGRRPSEIVALDVERLRVLCGEQSVVAETARHADELDLHRYIDLLRAHELEQLRLRLSDDQARMGLGGFIDRLLVPLNTLVGDAWMRGALEVYHEHALTEIQLAVLRAGIAALPDPGLAHPRVLLATVPGEPHWLGLLMAEAMLMIDGARCVSLGAQVPAWDIAAAADRFGCHVVVLGFTSYMAPGRLLASVAELRRVLAPRIELWAGGTAPALRRRTPEGVRSVARLTDLHAALLAWHAVPR